MPRLVGRLVLNDDVMLIPVLELEDEARAQIECAVDDVAVSRIGGRSGSKIIDADAAGLLAHFREPRSAVEAVILFARERKLEPDSVLESAYPMLRNMVDGGVLVQAQPEGEQKAPSIFVNPGDAVLGSVVTRVLQVLEDTEVYLLTDQTGSRSVLKLERHVRDEGTSARVRLEREADVLAALDRGVAPKLLGRGSLDGKAYIHMEFLPGVDAVTAATEWRERRDAIGRRELLLLAARISRTYADLHAQHILHGDVHPRNVLVGSASSARLVDFGLARSTSTDASVPWEVERGGIAFFFEPELARAYLNGVQQVPTSLKGEQYAVAALIYLLLTGTHWQDFRLDRDGMLHDIAERPVLSFSERGVAAWPSLESVLSRAMSKDPGDRFPSMAEFSEAIASISSDTASQQSTSVQTSPRLQQLLARTRAQAAIGGRWLTGEPLSAPFASLTYGSSGIALGLLCIAQRERDAVGLATADVWSCRSTREIDRDGAFYNPDIDITPNTVGSGSPYHSASGVHATGALIARSAADVYSQIKATHQFIDSARRPLNGLDLTLGTASTILGSAILLDAASGVPGDWTLLRELGDSATAELWQALDAKPSVRDADIDYLNIAHGWAGFLYATLQYCRVSGRPFPEGVIQRLEELSALAMPAGRGLEWPWVLRASGDPPVMAGWCNGSAGQVFLWSLAHKQFGDVRWLTMAEGAAWNSWESADPAPTLCCGLVGRAYALLNFFRHTGDSIWLDRARTLANRAAKNGAMPPEYSHSLYKGEFGLAVLAADLEVPQQAVMPFFEPFGYSSAAL